MIQQVPVPKDLFHSLSCYNGSVITFAPDSRLADAQPDVFGLLHPGRLFYLDCPEGVIGCPSVVSVQ